jgi:uncharacterized phage protein gp47/JayE
MATPPKDRREKLLESTTRNGIDFVEVASADQRTLRVHFLNRVALKGTVTNPRIRGGENVRTVAVNAINDATDWSTDVDGRPILTLTTVAVGDFSFYTLTLQSAVLDAFFTQSKFSFKATCPSDLDCEAPPAPLPPPEGNLPPIDYLAKDFLSFRKALLDFSALRYPEWQERSEADFGMMFLESLAGLADDLSYTQDRVAAEAAIETATQRRSIVRLARLVDYEPRPATSASVLLQFDVSAAGTIPGGMRTSGLAPDGQAVVFETGTGLADRSTHAVDPNWNAGIQPYYWDDSQSVLPAGSSEMWVVGHGLGFTAGQALVIDTAAVVVADPPIRELVDIVSATEESDELFLDASNNPTQVTHLVWDAKEALVHDHDLSRTTLAGNLVPSTQGQRFTESFAVDQSPVPAIVRTGANQTSTYLYTLANTPVAWLAADAASQPVPEFQLLETAPANPAIPWTWNRTLLDAASLDLACTLERASYVPVAKNSDGTVSYEYDSDNGDTIRFGDGVFGSTPKAGTVFQATYRVGAGADGNLAANAISSFDRVAAHFAQSVTNPFAATGGADQESNDTVRRLAPEAFRAVQFRAVRPQDYVAAAQTLDWVERAGTTFRWTGSWLTVFTTADPKGSEQITIEEELELIRLLNRRRLAGYESYAPAPHFISLDIQLYVCARPDAFNGDVKAAILQALSRFFSPDNFTFGTALDRSALEAAIQRAYGVAGVHSLRYRRRGIIGDFVEMPDLVTVGTHDILRVDNDPSLPEHGSVRVYVEGGK